MRFSRQGCWNRLPFPSFALFPRACGILCVLLKSEVFIYISPMGFPKLSPAGFQSQMLWRLIYLMQEPQGGEPVVRFRTLIPMVSLCNAIILQVCVHVAHLGYMIWLYHEPTPPTNLTVVHSLCFCVCQVASVMSDSFWPHGLPARGLFPWDSPGKNTGVGYHAILKGIFLIQGLNPGLWLLHCWWIPYWWATREALGLYLKSYIFFQ